MPLLERERQVLTTIVESYIADAAPVGSRTVAKTCGLNLSPASIRNIMSDLTEQGYLEQPHASAGRIPSAQAFRLYINEVMRLRPLAESQKSRITGLLGAAGPELGDILRQASRILSGHSLQVSLVIAPRHADARWKRIEFTLINPGLIMAVLILQGGMVLDRLLETSPDITADDLTTSANYLNHLFGEMTVSEVRAKLLAELRKAETQFGELYRRALGMAAEAFAPEVARELFVDGTANIVNQPEFSDVGRMAELLRVLENRTKLLELLDKSMDEFKTVFILGEESELESFREFASISTPYGPSDHPLGALGVIGPVRMDYARLAPVLNFTARALTRMLDRRF